MSSAQQPGVFTRRHLIMVIVLVLSGFARAVAQPLSAAPPQRASSTASLASLKQDLVIADRILFDERFLDTAGHVSVRLAPDRFLMAWRRALSLSSPRTSWNTTSMATLPMPRVGL